MGRARTPINRRRGEGAQGPRAGNRPGSSARTAARPPRPTRSRHQAPSCLRVCVHACCWPAGASCPSLMVSTGGPSRRHTVVSCPLWLFRPDALGALRSVSAHGAHPRATLQPGANTSPEATSSALSALACWPCRELMVREWALTRVMVGRAGERQEAGVLAGLCSWRPRDLL